MEFEFGAARVEVVEVGARGEERVSTDGDEIPRGFDAELTLYCSQEAERLNLLELAASVEVWWNGRLRTTAGMADYRRTRIELNPLLMKFQPSEPGHTLRHELAHLVAHVRAGRMRRIAAHGAEWRQACVDLGIPGEKANHSLPLAPRRRVTRQWRYRCGQCGQTHERVRPYRGRVACWECCRAHSSGRYHEKFLLRGQRIARGVGEKAEMLKS
jgi:SprT protein